MLVLTRKIEQSITITVGDEEIKVHVLGVDSSTHRVKLGIAASARVLILRTELIDQPGK